MVKRYQPPIMPVQVPVLIASTAATSGSTSPLLKSDWATIWTRSLFFAYFQDSPKSYGFCFLGLCECFVYRMSLPETSLSPQQMWRPLWLYMSGFRVNDRQSELSLNSHFFSASIQMGLCSVFFFKLRKIQVMVYDSMEGFCNDLWQIGNSYLSKIYW